MARSFPKALLILVVFGNPVFGGELYYTGFENFPVGNNTIAGTDGWSGSSAHLTLNLSGVDAEAAHLVAGIGNAAFIGGNTTVLPPITSRTVNVRRAINVDPLALGQEVLLFYVNFGIADSTPAGVTTRRDNFEFAFYNQAGQLIGFVQFDNSTIEPPSGAPLQKIWRSSYNGSSLVKVSTGAVFFYNVLMQLVVRINFRTNRWSAYLDGVDLFADQVFYSGPNVRNFGVMAAQMQIVGTAVNLEAGQLGPVPGDNYMLFDDIGVRIDSLPPVELVEFELDRASGAVRLRWQNEALYHYQILYCTDLTTWKSDLPGSSSIASYTGVSPVFADSSAGASARRFYQIVRTPP